jgi:hypothetical protein
LNKDHIKYYFANAAFLLIFLAPLHHYLFTPKQFEFTFLENAYVVFFWRIYLSYALICLLNAILYLVLFHYRKTSSDTLYLIHFWIMAVCITLTFAVILFQTHNNYYYKYYSFNDFYKLQIRSFLNKALSLLMILKLVAQLLLPVNVVYSLFKRGNTT